MAAYQRQMNTGSLPPCVFVYGWHPSDAKKYMTEHRIVFEVKAVIEQRGDGWYVIVQDVSLGVSQWPERHIGPIASLDMAEAVKQEAIEERMAIARAAVKGLA